MLGLRSPAFADRLNAVMTVGSGCLECVCVLPEAACRLRCAMRSSGLASCSLRPLSLHLCLCAVGLPDHSAGAAGGHQSLVKDALKVLVDILGGGRSLAAPGETPTCELALPFGPAFFGLRMCAMVVRSAG